MLHRDEVDVSEGREPSQRDPVASGCRAPVGIHVAENEMMAVTVTAGCFVEAMPGEFAR